MPAPASAGAFANHFLDNYMIYISLYFLIKIVTFRNDKNFLFRFLPFLGYFLYQKLLKNFCKLFFEDSPKFF